MTCEHLTLHNESRVNERAENLGLNPNDPNNREQLEIEFIVNKVGFRLRDVQTYIQDDNYYGVKCIVIILYNGVKYVSPFNKELLQHLDYEINIR